MGEAQPPMKARRAPRQGQRRVLLFLAPSGVRWFQSCVVSSGCAGSLLCETLKIGLDVLERGDVGAVAAAAQLDVGNDDPQHADDFGDRLRSMVEDQAFELFKDVMIVLGVGACTISFNCLVERNHHRQTP